MKKIILCLIAAAMLITCSCSQNNSGIGIDRPEKISTGDQIYSAKNENAVEESDNVNGMRFTLSLSEFTDKYNEIARQTDGVWAIDKSKWKVNGDETTDSNGVKIRYYYYDESNCSLTATVEADTGKLLNAGLGTTMANFVEQTDTTYNSDLILKKCAVIATAACQFPTESLDVMQDIFYRTTFETNNSFWYQGFIFTLSTQEDSSDSQKSVMLLRVFPVKDELKDEWNITDYDEYIAQNPNY